MPRVLGKDIKNAFNVRDPISGDVLTVYFRLPTPAERQAYDSDKFQREGKQIKIRVSEARQKWGGEILTGVKEGCFLKKLEDGSTVIFSSPFDNVILSVLISETTKPLTTSPFFTVV